MMMAADDEQKGNSSIETEKDCVHFPKLYPLLPEFLLSKTTNQAISLPTSLLERLNYLWSSANEILTENEEAFSISHRLSKSFMQIIIKHDIALPDNILIRICSSCSILLIPGVNCTSRLRPRSKKSNINRSRRRDGIKNSLKSELIRTCKLCETKTSQLCGFQRVENLSANRKSILDCNISATKNKATALSEVDKDKVKQSKFSFLNNMKGGGKRELQSASQTPAKIQKPSNSFDGLDFVKLSNFGSPSFSPPQSFNLLELEKLKRSVKKNQRRASTNLSNPSSGR